MADEKQSQSQAGKGAPNPAPAPKAAPAGGAAGAPKAGGAPGGAANPPAPKPEAKKEPEAPEGLDAASLAALGEQLAAMDLDAATTAETAGAAAGVSASAVAVAATSGAMGGGGEPGAPDLPEFDLADFGVESKDIDLLSDVNLNVTIELGRTRMLIEDVLKLVAGAVIELDKLAGDPVDVFVNGRLVAKGEVLVLNDNFCVRVNEIVDAAAAEKA